MSHERCKGKWEKSRLKPSTGGEEDDGDITINTHAGGTFTGRHHKTGASLTDASCDGVNLSFTRTTATEKVTYSGRIKNVSPTLDIIDGGKFRREKKVAERAGGEEVIVDSGDWTGEKIT